MNLALRTDKSEAYIGLWQDGKEIKVISWEAERELSAQLLQKIEELCTNGQISPKGLKGIVVFEGPGSYTGLRIGMSVANALAYSHSIPITASAGDDWISEGLYNLQHGEIERFVVPDYGGNARVTKPKK